MKLSTRIEGQTGIVWLGGEFTFDTHPSFNTATQELMGQAGLNRIILDMTGVTRMDASSLGILLILREATQAGLTSLALRKPSPSVLSLLTVVHFEKLFEILT